MKHLLFVILFISNFAYSGTMYKCKDDAGKLGFQDRPCSKGEATVEKQVLKTSRSGSIEEFSMWVEPNFVDTQYSALLNSVKVNEIESTDIHKHIPFGWMPYSVKAEVRDVYKGDIKKGDMIEVLIYIPLMSKYQLRTIENEFILSFCKSKSGVFYTSRNSLVQEPTAGNVNKFEQVRKHGTDYSGSGDCSGN